MSVCARRSLAGVGKEVLAAMCEGEACRCGEEELAGVERKSSLAWGRRSRRWEEEELVGMGEKLLGGA